MVSDQIIYEGPVNLFRGFEGVGGKLTLTNECLLFEPHRLNIQLDNEIIKLEQIIEIKKAKSLGIVPNSFIVKTAEEEFKFVVKKREEWIRSIAEHCPHI